MTSRSRPPREGLDFGVVSHARLNNIADNPTCFVEGDNSIEDGVATLLKVILGRYIAFPFVTNTVA